MMTAETRARGAVAEASIPQTMSRLPRVIALKKGAGELSRALSFIEGEPRASFHDKIIVIERPQCVI